MSYSLITSSHEKCLQVLEKQEVNFQHVFGECFYDDDYCGNEIFE